MSSNPEHEGWDPERDPMGQRVPESNALSDERVKEWRIRLEQFLEEYPGWRRFPIDKPIYALPRDLIQALGVQKEMAESDRNHRAKRPALTEEERKAEFKYKEMCDNFHPATVGAWTGSPVFFDLLMPAPSVPSLSSEGFKYLLNVPIPEKFADLPFPAIPDVLRREIEELRRKFSQPSPDLDAALRKETEHNRKWLEAHRCARLRWLGALTFCESYRDERDRLRAQWDKLTMRPTFPLDARRLGDPPRYDTHHLAESDRNEARADCEQFCKEATEFMAKWRLLRLVTWELAEPQGFGEGVSDDLARLMKVHGQRVDFDPCYDSAASVLVPQFNRGDGAISVGQKEEKKFLMWYYERAIRARYGLPRGIVDLLETAFSRKCQLSVDKVKRYRREYLQLLNSEYCADT